MQTTPRFKIPYPEAGDPISEGHAHIAAVAKAVDTALANNKGAKGDTGATGPRGPEGPKPRLETMDLTPHLKDGFSLYDNATAGAWLYRRGNIVTLNIRMLNFPPLSTFNRWILKANVIPAGWRPPSDLLAIGISSNQPHRFHISKSGNIYYGGSEPAAYFYLTATWVAAD